MGLILRDCQSDVINETRVDLRSYRNVLVQAATGFGKTVLSAFMAGSANDKGKKVYFICHRSELIYQTHLTFNKVGIQHGFIAAGYTPEYHQSVQICSIDTLKRRFKDIPIPDLCIWDEAHHVGAAGWSAVHGFYDKAFHIGLSATPTRLDGKGLGQWFDKMVCGPSVAWLIEQGYLSDYRLISTPLEPDLSSVKTRMGDFKKDELDGAVDTADLVGDVVRHYLKYARGKKTIMFAVSVKHSQHLVAQFRANGIMAVHLDGKTPKEERKKASRAFAQGHIDVLSNVGLFGEGYDLAAQSGMDVNIECVIDAAPTQSLSLCLQKWGRALRPKDYPAIILDHAGNWKRHGLPDQEREWSLEGDTNQGKKKAEDSNPVKQCPKCYDVHFTCKVCPNCGHVYEVVGRELEVEDGELVEIDKEQVKRDARREQHEANSLDELIELGQKRGYKNPQKWAAHVYTSRIEKSKQKEREAIKEKLDYKYWIDVIDKCESKGQVSKAVEYLDKLNEKYKFMAEENWVDLTHRISQLFNEEIIL